MPQEVTIDEHKPLVRVQLMNCSPLFFASHFFSIVCHRNHPGSYCLVHGNYCTIGSVSFCPRNRHDSAVHADSYDNVIQTMIDSIVMVMRGSVVVALVAVVR